MKTNRVKAAYFPVKYQGKWESMRHILPSIESAWQSVFSDYQKHVQNLTIQPEALTTGQISKILNCDVIIFPNVLTEWIRIFRNHLGFRGRFILHTHGNGTKWFPRMGQSPDFIWKSDIFVCASQAEVNSVRVCFSDATVEKIPFSIENLERELTPTSWSKTPPSLFYIGRISEQKNLHSLIWALSLLRHEIGDTLPRLEIFGAPDGLGSPNMGLDGYDYQRYLEKLTANLKLKDKVRFHGFIASNKLREICLSQRHIFVSPSIHSDEDFGVAALGSLKAGAPCVLSRWGGHLDFFANFGPEQIQLVPVYLSDFGPYLSPVELASCIKTALKKAASSQRFVNSERVFSENYSQSVIASKLATLLHRPTTSQAIASSTVRQNVLKDWREQKRIGIYKGYDDPNARLMFQAYGAIDRRPPQDFVHTPKRWTLPPWVSLKSEKGSIWDPIRGELPVPKFARSEARLRWLASEGFAFSAERIIE